MTRSMPGPLAAALAASPRKVAECLVIAARDGTRACFTTWSAPLTVDFETGQGNESCALGMNLAAVTLAVGLDASFGEVAGPYSATLTRAAVEGGRWNDASAWLVRVSPGVAGIARLLMGKVREVRAEDARWSFELRNQGDAFNQPLDRLVTAYCDAELGDARCGFALVPVAATVSVVSDALRLTVTYSGSHADGFFNLGRATFTAGVLAGVTSEQIHAFEEVSPGTGTLVLWTPLLERPTVGDPLELRQGCAKIRQSDDPAVPTCATFGNVINFRGFPDAPGRDVLLYPNSGGA